MKITFLLPTHSGHPVGGYKVAYEYANRLTALGHELAVVHERKPAPPPRLTNPIRKLLKVGWYGGPPSDLAPWMGIDPRVEMTAVEAIDNTTVPPSDAYIATAWLTAEWLDQRITHPGERYYLVQDYEFYCTAKPDIKQRMIDTYKLGFKTFAISPAVTDMLEEVGVHDSLYQPNGIDLGHFEMTRPIDDPKRTLIGFPHRKAEWKRTELAVEALELVRQRRGGELEAWSFGTGKPDYMPGWIDYQTQVPDADLKDLYNRSAVFVTPSDFEGWGLPGSEAMVCGAALVSTQTGGVRAYAEHEVNALLTPIGDAGALAEAVCRLLDDDALRHRFAEAGRHKIAEFTWERAVESLVGYLSDK